MFSHLYKKIITAALVVLLSSSAAMADTSNTLSMSDITTTAGSQVTLSISMKNAATITGFQFDMYLPDGVTIVKDSYGDELIELSTERTTLTHHTVSWNAQSDGAMRVACTSLKNYTFSGTTGEVLTITLDVASTMAAGNYTVQMKAIELTTPTLTPYTTDLVTSTLTIPGSSWTCSHIHGDVNGDGEVTIEDLTELVDILLKK